MSNISFEFKLEFSKFMQISYTREFQSSRETKLSQSRFRFTRSHLFRQKRKDEI